MPDQQTDVSGGAEQGKVDSDVHVIPWFARHRVPAARRRSGQAPSSTGLLQLQQIRQVQQPEPACRGSSETICGDPVVEPRGCQPVHIP